MEVYGSFILMIGRKYQTKYFSAKLVDAGPADVGSAVSFRYSVIIQSLYSINQP